jgi:hypothetical protein
VSGRAVGVTMGTGGKVGGREGGRVGGWFVGGCGWVGENGGRHVMSGVAYQEIFNF